MAPKKQRPRTKEEWAKFKKSGTYRRFLLKNRQEMAEKLQAMLARPLSDDLATTDTMGSGDNISDTEPSLFLLEYQYTNAMLRRRPALQSTIYQPSSCL
jgi:hypothetical protein